MSKPELQSWKRQPYLGENGALVVGELDRGDVEELKLPLRAGQRRCVFRHAENGAYGCSSGESYWSDGHPFSSSPRPIHSIVTCAHQGSVVGGRSARRLAERACGKARMGVLPRLRRRGSHVGAVLGRGRRFCRLLLSPSSPSHSHFSPSQPTNASLIFTSPLLPQLSLHHSETSSVSVSPSLRSPPRSRHFFTHLPICDTLLVPNGAFPSATRLHLHLLVFTFIVAALSPAPARLRLVTRSRFLP